MSPYMYDDGQDFVVVNDKSLVPDGKVPIPINNEPTDSMVEVFEKHGHSFKYLLPIDNTEGWK